MGGLFGKSKKPQSRVTEHDKAVLQLKQQRDKLKLYQKKITSTLELDRNLAKRLLHDGKKERAKLILRKKRYQEQMLIRTDGQLENLEKMTNDLEFAQVEVQVLNGLKTGNAALKKFHEIMSIDEVERILEETHEGIEKQREIDALLFNVLTDEDNEAVEDEFEAMIAEELPEVPVSTVANAEPYMEFPEVPSEDIGIDEAVAELPRKKKSERVAIEE